MGARMSDQNVLSDEEFNSAAKILRQLLPDDECERLQPSGPATVYTTYVTLWMMVLQRLGGGKSLTAVVKDVLSHNQELLPNNKRRREGTLSEKSGAYSGARTRLKTETVERFATRVSDSLIAASPASIEGHLDGALAFILDGTTMTLAPTDELLRAFPPATNQHGNSVWPVAMLLVAHELRSSCALPPEIGAMYGENNTSEAKLAKQIGKRLPRASVVLADSAYGIFSVAFAMVGEGHRILFRMTKSRFKSLKRQATQLEKWDGHSTWRHQWTPSANDRKSNPDLPEDAAVDVLLHEVPLGNETLYLITTLEVSSEQAGEYYARRYDVEHDIRDVKVTLNTENIRAKSVDMLRKELLASIVAYNLVVQFRRQAAKLAGVLPRRLSFTGVWNTFQSFLLTQHPCSAAEWTTRYDAALKIASRDKLPNRPGRSYPRRAHTRRQKSTKFMKKEAAKRNKKEAPPPPEKPK
jgi:hypothetical protein